MDLTLDQLNALAQILDRRELDWNLGSLFIFALQNFNHLFSVTDLFDIMDHMAGVEQIADIYC